MMKRHIQILTIILILQIGLAAVVFWPRSAATSERGEALLSGFTSDVVQQIEIEDADGDTITLAKSDVGWGLPEIDDYPVDGSKILNLVGGLLSITSDRLIARTDASYRRLKVAADDFERKIVLSSNQGELSTIYVGSSPSFGSAHVRVASEAETYLTGDFAAHQANADAASWVDTAYLSVPKEEIQRIRLENANGMWEFEKDEDGNWTIEGLEGGEQLVTSAMTNLENRASSVTLSEPLGLEKKPEYGIDIPTAILVVRTEDESITLRVGALDSESGTYVVRSSQSEYYVRVSEFSLQALVENSQEDFVELLPTPTPDMEALTPTPEATPAE